MREIIFRGKEKHTAKWVYGVFACKDETAYAFAEDYKRYTVTVYKRYYIVEDELADWGLLNRLACYEVTLETIGQYTGMTDKNGDMIFEGDVVRLPAIYGSGYATVEFCGTAFKAVGESFAYRISGNMEIVGNIHDNPELRFKEGST